MKRPIIVIIIALLLIPGFFQQPVGAVGIRPMVIDLNMFPGETKEFEITLTPSETEEIVNLSFYQPVQLNTGGLAYQEADPELFPPVNWVQLETRQVVVPTGESRKVTGRVTVPFDAGATHTVIIMAEPVVEETETGVTFKVRYAIKININIERPGFRPEGEVTDFEFQSLENDFPVINAIFKNISPLHYDVSAEVTIRDEERRLIERVNLKTPIAWQSGRASTRIYPGAEVLFTGQVQEPLFPGKYELRLFFRYAEGRQIIQSKEIVIEEGDFPESRLKTVEISPSTIEATIRPGSVSSTVVNIENKTKETLLFKINGREVEPEYTHSIYQNLEVKVRGSEGEFEINPRSRKRLIISLQAPRETITGGYYGFLDFIQYNEKGNVEQFPVFLKALVTGEEEMKSGVEITSFYHYLQDESFVFGLDLKNTGAHHFTPAGEIIFKDQEGNLLTTTQFEEETAQELLPDMVGRITSTRVNLEPGEYRAEIRLKANNQELLNTDLPVVIEGEKEENN